MAKVHLFSDISELKPGFKLPLQYLGTSETPAARQVPDTVLLAWIVANTPVNRFSVQAASVSNDGSIAVSAGRLVSKVIVVGAAPGIFNLGTTLAGTEILEGESFDTDGAVYVIERYFNSAGSLYFGGGFAGALTVKLVLMNLT